MKKTTFSSLIKSGVMAIGFIAISSLSAQFQGGWKLTPKAKDKLILLDQLRYIFRNR